MASPEARARKAAQRQTKREAKIKDRVDPVCCECGRNDPILVTGEVIYPHRPDLARKRFWRCNCGAYVGCHPRTDIPLGRPAGPATLKARSKAHAIFDPLWRAKSLNTGLAMTVARDLGYAWLAKKLGIPEAECHIAWMDRATAERVVTVIEEARAERLRRE